MPFDGSGNFSRSYNWQLDRDNGINILASRMDGEFDNFAAGMNVVFFRNGLVTMSGDLKMGGNYVTELGSGTTGNLSVRFQDDPNSGIFSPALGKIGFVAANTQRLEVNTTGVSVTGTIGSSGNAAFAAAASVGTTLSVGTNATVGGTLGVTGATTLASLGVTGNATVGGTLGVNGATTIGGNVTAHTHIATADVSFQLPINGAIRDVTNGVSTMAFDVSQGGATHGIFNFRSSSALTSRLYIAGNGFIGLNNGDPSRALDLGGTDTWVKFGNGVRSYLIGTGSGSSFGIYDETVGAYRMNVDSSGSVNFAGDLSSSGNMYPGNLSNFIVGVSGGNPIFFYDSNDYFAFDRTNNVYSFVIGSSGVLSIGSNGGMSSPNIPDAVGYKAIPFLASAATAYTFVIGDISKCKPLTAGGWVIPANAAVAYPIGSILSGYNDSGANQTVSITTDTLRLEGTATTGTRTVAQRSAWRALKVNNTEWVVSGPGVS